MLVLKDRLKLPLESKIQFSVLMDAAFPPVVFRTKLHDQVIPIGELPVLDPEKYMMAF